MATACARNRPAHACPFIRSVQSTYRHSPQLIHCQSGRLRLQTGGSSLVPAAGGSGRASFRATSAPSGIRASRPVTGPPGDGAPPPSGRVPAPSAVPAPRLPPVALPSPKAALLTPQRCAVHGQCPRCALGRFLADASRYLDLIDVVGSIGYHHQSLTPAQEPTLHNSTQSRAPNCSQGPVSATYE